MGGSSKQPVPEKPQPIDYAKLMASANEQSRAAVDQQFKSQIQYYPQMEKLQLGTVSKIAGNLNNDYTKQAKGVIDQTYQSGANALVNTGDRINALGDTSASLGNLAARQAGDELALGKSLSAEEARNASQAARGAYAARGLGVGSGAAAAEILNRDAYGNARYQQRLQNAGVAQGMLGNTANIYGQGGGAYQNAANLGFAGANALVNLDPYQRSLGTGVNLGSGILGQTGQMIGNTYNQALGMAGNVSSFNTNMQASMYNSALNNNAATAAADKAMWGQIAGAGIGAIGKIGSAAAMCWVAREVYGADDPAWLEFRDWLLTRGSYRRVSRYAANGPRIAEYISSRPGWKARLRKWMDARRAEMASAAPYQY